LPVARGRDEHTVKIREHRFRQPAETKPNKTGRVAADARDVTTDMGFRTAQGQRAPGAAGAAAWLFVFLDNVNVPEF